MYTHIHIYIHIDHYSQTASHEGALSSCALHPIMGLHGPS